MLWNKGDLGMSLRYEASAKPAAKKKTKRYGVREPDDFPEGVTAMSREMPDAILRWCRIR